MKKIIPLLSMAFCSQAFSAEVPKAEITYMATWTPHVDVKVDTPNLDPENCGSGDLYRLDLINDASADKKLSTLLSAYMAGKSVGLSISGCAGDRPKIEGVRLYK